MAFVTTPERRVRLGARGTTPGPWTRLASFGLRSSGDQRDLVAMVALFFLLRGRRRAVIADDGVVADRLAVIADDGVVADRLAVIADDGVVADAAADRLGRTVRPGAVA